MQRIFNNNDKFDTKATSAMVNVIFFVLNDGYVECLTGHCSRTMPEFNDYVKGVSFKYNLGRDYGALKELLIIPSRFKISNARGVITSSRNSFHQIVRAFEGLEADKFEETYSSIITIGSFKGFSYYKQRTVEGNRKAPATLAQLTIHKGQITLANSFTTLNIQIKDLIAVKDRYKEHEEAKEFGLRVHDRIRETILESDGDLETFELSKLFVTNEYQDNMSVVEFAKRHQNEYFTDRKILEYLALKDSVFQRVFTEVLGYEIKKEDGDYIVSFPDWKLKREREYLRM